MPDRLTSTLLVPAALAIAVMTGGCSIKATFKQTTDTTSNITGTTSGHAWWSEDGLLNPEHKVIAFITLNQTNLEQDMAKGQGEYVTSLSALLGVPASERPAYAAAVQARYGQAQAASQNTPDARLVLLQETAQDYRQPMATLAPDQP